MCTQWGGEGKPLLLYAGAFLQKSHNQYFIN